MANDSIWIVTSEYVDNNFSGDVTGTVAEYFEDVYGGSILYINTMGSQFPLIEKTAYTMFTLGGATSLSRMLIKTYYS